MKRIKLTNGTARVSDNITEETKQALNELSELAYNHGTKPELYNVLPTFKNGGKMKAKLENYNGIDYLTFKISEEVGLTQLPVITKGTRQGTNAWTWNGDLEKPTLRPSVRTYYHNGKEMTEIHYWLNDGIADCLGDCKDGNAGKELTLLEVEQ